MGLKPRRRGMTGDQFRALALSLPAAVEAPHFARTSFRVNGKIFATMTAGGDEAMVYVRPPERLQALIDAYPGAFFTHGGWTTRYGSLGVKLADVEPALLRALVLESWERVAPRRSR